MPSLILIKAPGGPPEIHTFPLEMGAKQKLVIGRQKDGPDGCDIQIDDGKQSISRRHAILTSVNGIFSIQNISRNGVQVNNQVLVKDGPARPLKHEDRVKICDFLFRYHDERPAKQALPQEFHEQHPDPEDAADGDVTTVHTTVNRTAAQEFLEVAPSERLRALLDISTKLSSTLELDKLLPEINEILFSIFKQADRAFVIRLDQRGVPYAKEFKSRRPNTDDRFSKTIVRKCLHDMKGYLSEDATSDTSLSAAQSIADFRIRSFMCVPLATTDGGPLGALQLDTQDFGKKFREDDLKLLTVVANFASVAVEKAQVHLALLERDRQLRDIELARQVQLGFLPKTFPQVAGYEFSAYYNAAQTVGGDYYDFISLPGGRIAIMLGDVAGKGVPASLLMAKLSAESRYCMLTQSDPAKAVMQLNNNLCQGGIADRFITLTALVLDPITHTVTVVNAGQMTPLRFRGSVGMFGECVDEDMTGLPLGVMENYEYQSRIVPLEPGDSITVFTDGVTDAMDQAGKTFELDGVRTAMAAALELGTSLTPKSIGEQIVQAVKRHASGRAQNDDIALVCFGRIENALDYGHFTSVNPVVELPRLVD